MPLMKYRNLLFTGYIVVAATFCQSETYTIDEGHTRIGFSIRHFVINRIHGSFTKFSGTVIYNPDNVPNSSVRGVIDSASINTSNEKRDYDLRGVNFFDVARYPEISFESTRVEGKNGKLNVSGKLTLHGVTREISFPVTVSSPIKDLWGKQRIGISGRLTINRHDFGLVYDRKLDNGEVVLSDNVEIELDAEAQTNTIGY
jgi:polyisoprenoid-binding protein YceI